MDQESELNKVIQEIAGTHRPNRMLGFFSPGDHVKLSSPHCSSDLRPHFGKVGKIVDLVEDGAFGLSYLVRFIDPDSGSDEMIRVLEKELIRI